LSRRDGSNGRNGTIKRFSIHEGVIAEPGRLREDAFAAPTTPLTTPFTESDLGGSLAVVSDDTVTIA
jgi:hypothetical protein